MKQVNENPTLYSEVGIKGDFYGVYVYDKETKSFNFEPCGRKVEIIAVEEFLETKEERLKIKFLSDITSKEFKEVTLPRESLERKSASELLKIGIDAQSHNLPTFFKLMHKQELTIKKTVVHTGLGWDKVIVADGRENVVFKAFKTLGDIKSLYAGKLEINPTGSKEVYREMLKKEVIGHIPLEFSFVLGLAPVLLGYRNLFNPMESIVAHFFGDSSTGKTTSAKLSCSTSSKPSFIGDTLMSSFKATKNAITCQLVGNHGFLQVFDELSSFEGKDITDLLYTFSTGREKNRLSKDALMKSTENWSTVILTTGEKSILTGCKKNTGLGVRVLSFGNIEWTKSAAHAERISNCINNNYGFANIRLAKYLLTLSTEVINEKVEFWRNKYKKATKVHDDFTDRISLKYAVILATAELAKEALTLELNTYKILDFMVINEFENFEEKDIGVKAYEHLIQEVQINSDSFGSKDGNEITDAKSFKKWGLIESLKTVENIDKMRCSKHIVIAETVLKSTLEDAGFEDIKIILKNWKNKKILISEKDRLISERKITADGVKIKSYVIRIIDK